MVALTECTLNDLKKLQAIAVQSYNEHYLYLWQNEKYAAWYINKSFGTESLQQQLRDPLSKFYFVTENNEAAGFIKLNLHAPLDNDTAEKSLELERIYLLQKASGKGVGTKAVTEVLRLARQLQKEVVWLKTMDSSPALYFYEKMGFKKIKVERLPFEGFKDAYRNIITMRLNLND